MPSRRLPMTDAQRTTALQTCAQKAMNTTGPNWLITPAQNVTLQGTLSPWRAAHAAAADALEAQTTCTANCATSFTACARVISHFIQVLNFAIERGVLPASDRAHYQLPVSHAEVPVINTSPAALLWAGNIETGENARTGQGGSALEWPSLGEVTAAATLLQQHENLQSTAKDTYDQAQQAIATQRPGVDHLIKDLWDTIEYNLRHQPAPSLRRRAREWGVVYINDDGTEETDPPEPPAPPTP